MAEEQHHRTANACDTHEAENEIKDRGLFDFVSKKEEEKPKEEDVAVSEFEKVHVSGEAEACEKVKEEEKPGLLEKLHRSNSSSSSSSSDEEGDKTKKEKKKKGLKEKSKDKISGEKEKEEKKVVEEEDTTVPIESVDGTDEKKGFLDKIKEKLPGGGQPTKAEDSAVECGAAKELEGEAAANEKKGILQKIKEKLPGYSKNGGDESATH